jgi:hypothetical protein
MSNSKEMKYITLFNNIPFENDDDDNKMFKDNFVDKFITDLELKKLSPSRYTYYKNLLEKYNKNPETIYKIYKKYNRFKDIKDVEGKYLSQLSFFGEGSRPADKIIRDADNIIYENSSYTPEQWKAAIQKIQDEEAANAKAQGLAPGTAQAPGVAPGAGTAQVQRTVRGGNKKGGYKNRGGDITGYKESKFRNLLKDEFDFKNITNLNQKIYGETVNNRSNTNTNKLKEFDEYMDKYNDGDIDNDDIKYRLAQFENDPENPLKQLEITFDDRLVFIIATFFIRYISLILIQWSIDINIIKNFEEGFLYYAIVYLSIMWFIIFFVNIESTFQVDYMNFDNIMNSVRSLFYYFYMGTNGITRLFIHTFLICILLVIPIILNIKKTNEYDDEKKDGIIDFEQRKKLMKTLSLFTIYVWILTSIIATKF